MAVLLGHPHDDLGPHDDEHDGVDQGDGTAGDDRQAEPARQRHLPPGKFDAIMLAGRI
jgi:hypothetical protein